MPSSSYLPAALAFGTRTSSQSGGRTQTSRVMWPSALPLGFAYCKQTGYDEVTCLKGKNVLTRPNIGLEINSHTPHTPPPMFGTLFGKKRPVLTPKPAPFLLQASVVSQYPNEEDWASLGAKTPWLFQARDTQRKAQWKKIKS